MKDGVHLHKLFQSESSSLAKLTFAILDINNGTMSGTLRWCLIFLELSLSMFFLTSIRVLLLLFLMFCYIFLNLKIIFFFQLRHISFVDCPGHHVLVSTMLTGASIMDSAILLVSVEAPCPAPQTKEHFSAACMRKISNILIAQNKVDLANEEDVLKHYEGVSAFYQI